MLERGADPNRGREGGKTLLLFAVESGKSDLAQVMLRRGADPNVGEFNGITFWDLVLKFDSWSLLSLAFELGNDPTALPQGQGIRALDAFAKHAGMDFGSYSKRAAERSLTFLHLAVLRKDLRALTLALNSEADLNSRTESGRTAAHLAVLVNWPDGLEALSDGGADLNAQDEAGETPLHLAAKMGAFGLLDLLFARGAAPAVLDKDNRTPLFYGLKSTSSTVSDLFIKRYIALDLEAANTELLKTLLKFVDEGNWEKAKFFLESGLRLNAEVLDSASLLQAVEKLTGKVGNLTMMHFAAKNNDVVLAKYLNELGVDFSAVDRSRRTVLHLAAANRARSAADYFLERGVDINATDRDGLAFVSYLVKAGNLNGVRNAVLKGCDLSVTAADGKTLLFFADSAEMVQLLIGLNPHLNINSEDESGRTALLDAQRRGYPSAMTALLSFGASLTQVLAKTGKTVVQQLKSEIREANKESMSFREILDKAELGYTSLHWAALFCDLPAVFSTLHRDKRSVTAMLEEAEDQATPQSIAQSGRSLCPLVFDYMAGFKAEADRYNRINTQRQQDRERRAHGNAMVAMTTAVGCAGAIGVQITLQSYHVLTTRSVLVALVPLLPFTASAASVVALSVIRVAELPREAVVLTAAAGTIGIALGAAIVAVVVAGTEGRLLTRVKRWGTKRSDACWWIADATMCISVGLLIFAYELLNSSTQDLAQIMAGLLYALCAIATLACQLNNIKLRPHLRAGTGLIILSIVVGTWVAQQTPVHVSARREPELEPELAPGCILILGALAASLTVDCLPCLVQKALDMAFEMQAVDKESNKFQATKLVLGRADAAAQGLEAYIGLSWEEIAKGAADGLKAMEQEVRAFGDADDLQNYQYVAYKESLHPDHIPSKVQESMHTGEYHGGTMQPEDYDAGHGGRRLSDWMKLDEVVIAKLTEAEFVAVRFYTSSSFWRINGPLRRGEKHPWPMVVYFLTAGIKKLRAVQAQLNPEEFAGQTTLWRGMKNTDLDVDAFRMFGGTELAPMSTTTCEDVAKHYAHSEAPLVFKYSVQGLKAGVNIQFLSLYPKEEEYLYPPLTFLTYRHHFEDDGTKVVIVEPVMS